MTFIDFFAGVGGFRKGMELEGHKCLGFCEYDKFAVQSYSAIHNTEGEWYAKDVREVRANDIPKADCWCAGFPCQDISAAGKQLGFKGKRSSLFFAVTGLIADLEKQNRPKLLFFENVKNLLSVNRGFDFAKLLVELDKIGYDAEWAVINTADVLPQNRERVFVIGHLRGERTRQVFPIAGSGKQNNSSLDILQIANIMPTKTRQNPNQGRVYDPSGISPALNCMEGGGREPRIAIPCLTPDRQGVAVGGIYTQVSAEFQFGIMSNRSRTLKANSHDAGVVIINGAEYLIRKFTPLECWRLQGREDEDFFRAFFLEKNLAHKFNIAYQQHRSNPVRLMQWAIKHQKMSDNQLYKQAGNGVTTLVVKAIAERLEDN